MEVLKDVVVVDFTQAYSGPFCTMQLADFGARVIKIERRGIGDQAREWTPVENGHSGYFAAINRNKYGISLDISKEEGRKVAEDLIRQADIVVENFKVGTMEKWGLDYEQVKKINPQIIYASLTGFGQTGERKYLAAYDNVVQSMSGIMDMTGFPDGVPTRVGPAIGDNFTGLNMTLAIVMAYYHRLKTGEGQKLDVAMLDTVFGILESPILFKTLLDKTVTRCGNNDAATLVPYDVYPCKDGYFSAGLASDAGWPKFCRAIGREELIEDSRFCDNDLRCRNYQMFTDEVLPFFQRKTREELEALFTEHGIPNAPVLGIEEIMQHPQIHAREMLVPLEDAGIGRYQAIGNPMKLSKTPAEIRFGAPVLGQHTDRILRESGYEEARIRALYEAETV